MQTEQRARGVQGVHSSLIDDRTGARAAVVTVAIPVLGWVRHSPVAPPRVRLEAVDHPLAALVMNEDEPVTDNARRAVAVAGLDFPDQGRAALSPLFEECALARNSVVTGAEERGPVFGGGFWRQVFGRAVKGQRRESCRLTVGAIGDLSPWSLRGRVLQKAAVAADGEQRQKHSTARHGGSHRR